MVITIMNIAGVLWLVVGANVIFAGSSPLTLEHGILGGIFMSSGMLFIGIGGIIGVLNKLALRVPDPQAHRL